MDRNSANRYACWMGCLALSLLAACGRAEAPATSLDAGIYKVDVERTFELRDPLEATSAEERAGIERANERAREMEQAFALDLQPDGTFELRMVNDQFATGTWQREGERLALHTNVLDGTAVGAADGAADSHASLVEDGLVRFESPSTPTVFLRRQ